MAFKMPHILSDLMSDSREGIRRVKVENGLSSFEDNRQFRFFDRLSIPNGDYQRVYSINIQCDTHLLVRVMSLYDGGLKYSVYSQNSPAIFSGTLIDADAKVFPVNPILRPGLTSHPDNNVMFSTAQGENIFDPNGAIESIGFDVLASSGPRSLTSEIDIASIQLGFAAGTQLWAVFDVLPGILSQSVGVFEYVWEECV